MTRGAGSMSRYSSAMISPSRKPASAGHVATGVLLQELLILALQVLLENDAPNVEAAVLVSEPGLLRLHPEAGGELRTAAETNRCGYSELTRRS